MATDPLVDNAKAFRCNDDSTSSFYSSSSSDTACSVSDLAHTVLATRLADPNDVIKTTYQYYNGSTDHRLPEAIHDLLCPPLKEGSFRARLLTDVSATSDALSSLLPNRTAHRRAVMARLRSAGYDAGICKVIWAATGVHAVGNHEYIDVVVAKPIWRRYIVELDFAAEFEIARPAPGYGRILAALPRVVVETAEEMRLAVGAVSEAVGWSFRMQGLPVPPWRKSRYMLAKWLGPYRRTVNPAAASGGAVEIKCRVVGFHPAESGMTVRTAARIL